MLGFLPTRAYRPGTPGATTFLSPLSGTFNYGWDSFTRHRSWLKPTRPERPSGPHLQQSDYQNSWTLWPGKGELYTGQEPHGMLLTTYLNDIALQALNSGASTMPPGAIIVKENYMPDRTLAAITTMFKVQGYNPDVNDWFFTKHLPSGELDRAPTGMALEGRLPGCTNCHRAMQGNDWVFTGQLGEGA